MSRRIASVLVSLLLVLGAGVAVAVEGSSDTPPPDDCACLEVEGVEECEVPADADCEPGEEPGEPEAEEPEEPKEVEEAEAAAIEGDGEGDDRCEEGDVAMSSDADGEESADCDKGMPPFLGEDAEMEMPPGLADREVLPYGLAKKLDPELLPPGQAKQADPENWQPPGHAKKGDDWQPPGKAKRNGG